MNEISQENLNPDLVQQLGRLDLIAQVITDGIKRGLHRGNRKGFSTEFSDYKQYVAGDDIRQLDWRAYARSDRLYIKCFESETSIRLHLMLDATKSMSWRWQDKISKLEYSVNLLCALAQLHIIQQDPVGILINDASKQHFLEPKARRSQLDVIFAIMDSLEPGSGGILTNLVNDLTALRTNKGIIMLCTDLEEDREQLELALRNLGATQHEIILFHILDHAEETFPFADSTHVQDSETGAILPISVRTQRKNYLESVKAFRNHWQSVCERENILYVPTNTAMNYVDLVYSMIQLRNN